MESISPSLYQWLDYSDYSFLARENVRHFLCQLNGSVRLDFRGNDITHTTEQRTLRSSIEARLRNLSRMGPTQHFAISKLQSPSIVDSGLHGIRRSRDFKALKPGSVRSGNGINPSMLLNVLVKLAGAQLANASAPGKTHSDFQDSCDSQPNEK